VWRHTWRKIWVKCAVLTGNSAGLRTVHTSRVSRRELCSSLRESHSFLSSPSDITMATSEPQGTQPPKINKREATLAFIEAYRSLRKLWDTENRHYSNRVKKGSSIWLSYWEIESVGARCSTTVIHAREDSQNWQKNWWIWWPICVVPKDIQFSFSCRFFTQLNCTV
jgi:hypothetical protein